MEERITLGNIIGEELEEEFLEFDLTVIKNVLGKLRDEEAYDLVQAEFLQQKALYAADLVSDFLAKIVKTVGYLEAKINTTKNKAALTYTDPQGNRTTSDMKKWFAESCADVEDLQVKLAKAKASKLFLEKKYDILVKTHHHYKDIAAGLRKTILGHNIPMDPLNEDTSNESYQYEIHWTK